MLTNVGRHSPPWVALFPRQKVINCLRVENKLSINKWACLYLFCLLLCGCDQLFQVPGNWFPNKDGAKPRIGSYNIPFLLSIASYKNLVTAIEMKAKCHLTFPSRNYYTLPERQSLYFSEVNITMISVQSSGLQTQPESSMLLSLSSSCYKTHDWLPLRMNTALPTSQLQFSPAHRFSINWNLFSFSVCTIIFQLFIL